MSRVLTRRHFLRGAGGLFVGLPLLELGMPRRLAHAADESLFPKRFIVFYHPNGVITDSFWPTAGSTERNFTFSEILEPLDAFREQLLILGGVNLESAAVGPGGPHQKGVGTVLTGMPLQEGTFRGGDGSLAGWADGQSIDQRIADHIAGGTRLPSLELGVRADFDAGAEVRSRISYGGPASPVPPQNDPRLVFDRLYSSTDMDASELTRIRHQRTSVLDSVLDQFGTVYAQAGVEDQARLESHFEMVRELELRLANERMDEALCDIPREPGDIVADSEDTMPDILRLQVDLLVSAFACDLTRVGSIQNSNAVNHIRFPWVESWEDGHSLSHMGPSNETARVNGVKRDRWYAEQFAYLLGRLNSVVEGDGTMLDNTCVLWVNEISVGNTHSHINMPFVLAGGAGGALDTGRFLDFGSEPHHRLLLTLLRAYGVEDETFGMPEFCADGPLSGLLL